MLLWGCDSGESDPPEGPPMEDPRIVFGGTIDGIGIGDDTTAVIAKLGRPNFIGRGDFPGVQLEYNKGEHAGLLISIVTEGDGPRGTSLVTILESYVGRSEEGIGVGSLRDEVIGHLGVPDSGGAGGGRSRIDGYNFENVWFNFYYPDSLDAKVETINMGRLNDDSESMVDIPSGSK